MKFVGLDVGKTWTYVCILNSQGKVVKETKVRSVGESLFELLGRQRGPISVCYEASCGYGPLYDRLCQIARQVLVAHPGHLRLIFRCKRKNDRVDARKLAKLLLVGAVPCIHVPCEDIRSWRRMIEFRNRLVQERTRLKNRLRALGRSFGIVLPAGRRLWTKQGKAALAATTFPNDVSTLERDITLDDLARCDEKIQRVERSLNDMGRRHSAVQLLQTIPGVGPRTAEAFVAYVDIVTRFRSIKQVAAYFGLVPSQDQSGDSNRLGHITREGPAVVRRLLTEAAWQGIRRSPRIRDRFERFCGDQAKQRRIALVATSHYLLRVMFSMWRRGEAWNEAGGPNDVKSAA